MNQFNGVGVALVTPFKEDLSLDLEALDRLIEYNIEGGTSYLVVLGTTAEAATLSPEEKQAVMDRVVKTNAGRLPLVLGIGGNNTMEVQRAIEKADMDQFDAILSVSPYYNRPSQEGLYQHYRALAQTGKPIIIYNVPSRTGQNLEAATTLRLAREFTNLFMIKEAAPNIAQYFDILRLKPEGFMLASGDDEYTLPVTLAGGNGVISVIGQAYPKEFSQMVALAKEGKVKEAYRIHNSLVEITRLIFAEGNPAGIKAVLAKKGIIQNYLRLPLVAASTSLEEKLYEQMQKLS